MDSIAFLELSDILEIHADQISNYGGTIEVRDAGILESAIEQPRATFAGQFLHAFRAAANTAMGWKNANLLTELTMEN